MSERAMRGAVNLARAAIPHALRVFDVLEEDPNVHLARYVLRRLRSMDAKRPTKRDLFEKVKGKNGLGTVGRLDSVLSTLEVHNLIRVLPRPSDGPGRAPSPRLVLNPEAVTEVRTIRRKGGNGPPEGDSANTANTENGVESETEEVRL